MDDPVYVIGHRNPDADAICSAIAYAAFKQATGHAGFIAARCGNTNPRIDAILQRFQVPLPHFLGDVTPRLQDIMVRDVIRVSDQATCSEALHLIDRHDVRALPVVQADGRIAGLVSIFILGEYFIPKLEQKRDMRQVHTSLGSLIAALQARVLHAVEPDRVEDLHVRVGAMDVRSFGKFTREGGHAPGQTVIIVGDRWDIQEKSIQLKVRLLIITNGLEVDPDIVEHARAAGVSLIISPYDTATTGWIVRTATRLAPLIDTSIATFHPEERVRQVGRRVATHAAPLFLVADEDRRLLGVFTKTELLKPVRTRLVLVDHNELSQAVPGADEVNILEVIDHHRLGSMTTEQPILFLNQPVGSTCTIVAGLYRHAGLAPTPAIAGILMSGIIADTLNLQSPTATATDHELLPWLAGLAGTSPAALSDMIFSSGSVILSLPPAEVVRSDQKIYEQGDFRYAVSQVEELGFDNFWKHLEALRAALQEGRQREQLLFAGLLVTDINTQNSLFLLAADPDFLQTFGYTTVDHPDVFDLPGIVSRKKQLIPYLTALLK